MNITMRSNIKLLIETLRLKALQKGDELEVAGIENLQGEQDEPSQKRSKSQKRRGEK